MGFRFRKSISIIPGVRVNLSNGAPSLSIGPRGASLSVGKNGTFAYLGLPGTGLSYRTRIDRTARERVNTRHQADPGLRSELELVVEKLISAHSTRLTGFWIMPDTGFSFDDADLK